MDMDVDIAQSSKRNWRKRNAYVFFADGKAERIGIPAKNYGHVHKGVSMFEIG